MHTLRSIGLSVLLIATLAACGERDESPDDSQTRAASPSAPGPWDTLAKIAPADQPYGLDVYTAQCASCHGELGQGKNGNPSLKGLSQTAMQQKLLAYRDGKLQGKSAAAKSGLSEGEIAAVSIYAGE